VAQLARVVRVAVGGRRADHLDEQGLVHNHAVEAQLQSVRTELEGIRACGQPHLIGALSSVLHVKGDGRASGVDEGGREVTGILWGGHRVLHRQPLDVARLKRNVFRVSHREREDVRDGFDVTAIAQLGPAGERHTSPRAAFCDRGRADADLGRNGDLPTAL